MKSKRSKATDLSNKVKQEVFERDKRQCIYCYGCRDEYEEKIINGRKKMARAFYSPLPNAHFISRQKGGLGIPENVITLCMLCHHDFDNGDKKDIGNVIENYLKNYYGDEWNKEKLVYKKGDIN